MRENWEAAATHKSWRVWQFAPLYLGLGNLLTMNALEPLFWMGCALVDDQDHQRRLPKVLVDDRPVKLRTALKNKVNNLLSACGIELSHRSQNHSCIFIVRSTADSG